MVQSSLKGLTISFVRRPRTGSQRRRTSSWAIFKRPSGTHGLFWGWSTQDWVRQKQPNHPGLNSSPPPPGFTRQLRHRLLRDSTEKDEDGHGGPVPLQRCATTQTAAGLTEKMFCSCDPGLGSAKTAERSFVASRFRLKDLPYEFFVVLFGTRRDNAGAACCAATQRKGLRSDQLRYGLQTGMR